MDIEHMKYVAKRNAYKSKDEFFNHLWMIGWSKNEIEMMWAYAQKGKGETEHE